MLKIAGVSCEHSKGHSGLNDRKLSRLLVRDHLGCHSSADPWGADLGRDPGARLLTCRAGMLTMWTAPSHELIVSPLEDTPCTVAYARYLLSGLHTASSLA